LATAIGARLPQTASDSLHYPVQEQCADDFQKASLCVLRNEARRQMVLAALALRRWQLRHGALPDRLDQLVPEFLRAAPRDPMDGAPLCYRRELAGVFTLYSVGANERDEGGAGDDLPWPKAAL
jgi:hypothetical protein